MCSDFWRYIFLVLADLWKINLFLRLHLPGKISRIKTNPFKSYKTKKVKIKTAVKLSSEGWTSCAVQFTVVSLRGQTCWHLEVWGCEVLTVRCPPCCPQCHVPGTTWLISSVMYELELVVTPVVSLSTDEVVYMKRLLSKLPRCFKATERWRLHCTLHTAHPLSACSSCNDNWQGRPPENCLGLVTRSPTMLNDKCW